MNIDTSELKKFAKELKSKKKDLIKGKEEYFDFLQDQVHIEARLKRYIRKNVYKKIDEPETYEWTKRLLSAVRSRVEDGKLVLYMSDKFLEEGHEYQETSPETGQDPSVHEGGNASKSYAERVEEGYTYHNTDQPEPNTVTVGPREYMKDTFKELKKEIKSGKAEPKRILLPLLRKW